MATPQVDRRRARRRRARPGARHHRRADRGPGAALPRGRARSSVAPATRDFLRAMLPRLEAAEMLLTERNGYNAVTTGLSSDFVQSDEAWWQSAWRDGLTAADAAFDSSAHQTTVSIATVVRDDTTPRSGVAQAGLHRRSPRARAAGRRAPACASTCSMPPTGSSSAPTRAPSGRRDRAASPRPSWGGRRRLGTGDAAASAPSPCSANGGRWRVIAHLPRTGARGALRRRGPLSSPTALVLLVGRSGRCCSR